MILSHRWWIGVWALGLALPGPASSTWKIRQLTNCRGGGSENPAISADGRAVVFVSSCELIEDQNPDHNRELFRWREGDSLEQLTNTRQCENMEPSPDKTGARIAWVSNCRFDQAKPDHNPEIAWLGPEGEIKLLTETAGSTASRPALSPSGRYLAFLSTADPLGQNPDLSQEVFLIDLAQPEKPLQQLSADEQSSCVEPMLADGAVVFACDGKRGDQNPEGNFEILAAAPGSGLNQLTHTRDCESREPQLNRAGNRVLFRSNCNPTGQNLNRYYQLFLAQGTQGISQITQDLAEGAFQPGLAGNGLRLAFVSRWGRELMNQDHNPEIFLLEFPFAGKPQLLLETTQGGSYGPRFSADGRRLVYYANNNPLDTNADGNFEIFLAEEVASDEENP